MTNVYDVLEYLVSLAPYPTVSEQQEHLAVVQAANPDNKPVEEPPVEPPAVQEGQAPEPAEPVPSEAPAEGAPAE
jgi:hypothetical protein